MRQENGSYRMTLAVDKLTRASSSLFVVHRAVFGEPKTGRGFVPTLVSFIRTAAISLANHRPKLNHDHFSGALALFLEVDVLLQHPLGQELQHLVESSPPGLTLPSHGMLQSGAL